MGCKYLFECVYCGKTEEKIITPFEPSDPGEETPTGWEWNEMGNLFCDVCSEEDLDMWEVEVELEEEKWPKVVQTYVHGSKEYGIDVGEEIGLTGEALASFKYLHYEVELTIEVEKDGDYIITHVDGKRVERDDNEVHKTTI